MIYNHHTYGNLSSLYYDLDAVHGAERELPFYRTYLTQAMGPILEPMCGTGNFLIPFTQEDFEIDGFDASTHMLERLAEKATAQRLSVSAQLGRLEDLSIAQRYALVFIPNCSINLILDHDTVIQCLHNIYTAMTHNGRFICELLTTRAWGDIDANTTVKTRTLDDGTLITVETNTVRCNNQYLTATHRYRLLRGNEILKTEDEEYTLKLYDPTAFEQMLKSIGFTHITRTRLYHHGEQPKADDDIIVFECKKLQF